jgi:hypothetical protein
MGEVPDALPVTEEARERLREQAGSLGAATVLRLIDLLHAAVEDMRQGGDPRLPLELALVKVTRASSDLSRESLAYRVERLEGGSAVQPVAPAQPVAAAAPTSRPRAEAPASPVAEEADTPPATPPAVPLPTVPVPVASPVPVLALDQLQEAWRRSVIPAVEQREPGGMPAAAMLTEAHPAALEGDTLTLEFPAKADFHRGRAEEPKNLALLQDALYEVTGRRLEVVFSTGERREEAKSEVEHPTTEEGFVELMKTTFDARELDA